MRIFVLLFSFFVLKVKSQSEILRKILDYDRNIITVSDECEKDLNLVKNDLKNKEIWALKCK
jgi:hypothetical protein